ncbi:MAG: hypothetical protein FJ100_09330 [Deltaproteobacteria bacterium]|nr:hypothetical protein [Deltaproteobacteria bacterium]
MLPCACADAPNSPAAGGAAASAKACPPGARRTNGNCCPSGQFFDAASSGCAALGPPACATSSLSGPASCVPTWCAGWHDAAGTACAPGSALCTGALAPCAPHAERCPAGDVPLGSGCAPAGSGVLLPDGTALVAPTAADAPFAFPELPPLPAVEPPRGCAVFGAVDAEDCAKVSACPVGEAIGPGGACAPRQGVPWACPPGFVVQGSLQGEPICVPDPAECGAAPYAPGPANAIHIDAAAPAGGNGSATAPFTSFAAAATAVFPGATVLLAAGTYAVNLKVSFALTLVGRCAAKTRLQSNGVANGLLAKRQAAPYTVEVRGVHLAGGLQAVAVTGPTTVLLRKVYVSGAIQVGLAVAEGGAIDAQDVVVDSTQPVPATGQYGFGAVVQAGSQMTLQRTLLSRNHSIGLALTPNAVAVASELAITGTQPDGAGDGSGVAVHAGAQFTATGLRIARSTGTAVRVVGAEGTALLTDAALLDTSSNPKLNDYGRALDVGDGAKVRLRGVRVQGNREVAVFGLGQGTRIDALDLLVRDTEPGATNGEFGIGLEVTKQATASARRVWLHRNSSMGAAVSNGGVLELRDALANEAKTEVSGALGRGFHAAKGGTLMLERVRASVNREAGIGCTAGTLTVIDALVDGTTADKIGTGGGGVALNDGCAAALTRVRLSGNRLGLGMAGGTAKLQQVTIDHSKPDAAGVGGFGVVLHQAAQLDVQQVLVAGGAAAGIAAAGNGTVVRGRHVVVRDVGPRQGQGGDGMGLAALVGGRLDMRDLVVQNCRSAGVIVSDSKSSGRFANAAFVAIRGSLVAPQGRGLVVQVDASVEVAGARMVGNEGDGILVQNGSLRAAGLRVHATLPEYQTGNGGAGIAVAGGAGKLWLDDSLVDHNRMAALSVDSGAAWVRGSVLAHTGFGTRRVDGAKALADGLVAHDAAAAELDACVLVGNDRSGVLVDGGGARIGHSLVTGGAFGVVLQRKPLWSSAATLVTGNSQQNLASDQGLQVPVAPQVVQVGSLE